MEDNQIPIEKFGQYFGIDMNQLLNSSVLDDELDSFN